MAKRLISAREFGARVDKSPRTVDRMLAQNVPGMPEIIWINGLRYFDEEAIDRFIGEIIKHGALPGQPRGDHRPKSKGARKAESA